MSRKKFREIGHFWFLGVAAVVIAALALAGSHPTPTLAESSKPIVWRLQSCWSASDFSQNNAKGFAQKAMGMSGGRLKIDVMAAGAIVPAFEVLDAVHRGILDASNSWSGYWMGKHPAATLFSSAPGGPFGMNSEDFLGWLYLGGGLELYNELLQKELKMNKEVRRKDCAVSQGRPSSI
jgi:TRAP-type mannitol/chloroaromatic compound transport system substrate-binding protein